MSQYLTESQTATSAAYKATKPKQLGSLHERMQYVMELTQKAGPDAIGTALWHAIFDLQMEVSFYNPVRPPYGSRKIP